MIKLLPHWVVTDIHPSFYDVESKTAIEQTRRIYLKMNELIDDYNKFVDEINTTITNLVDVEFVEFKCEIEKIVHDYIAMLDEKIKMQDLAIQNGLNEIKENIETTINEVLSEMDIQGGAKILETNTTDYVENMETYNEEYDIVVVHE